MNHENDTTYKQGPQEIEKGANEMGPMKEKEEESHFLPSFIFIQSGHLYVHIYKQTYTHIQKETQQRT